MVHFLAHVTSIEADPGEVSVPQFPSHFALLPFCKTETSRREQVSLSEDTRGCGEKLHSHQMT
jgi:hypothetical protein